MKLPCEIAVRSVVPAIRALLAKELTKTHGMKQGDAANLLGITQTAISKYVHHVRGSILQIKSEIVTTEIASTAVALVNGELKQKEVSFRICNVCRLIREQGLMCELCKQINTFLDEEECNLCISPYQSESNSTRKKH